MKLPRLNVVYRHRWVGFIVSWCMKEGGGIANPCHFNALNTTYKLDSHDCAGTVQAYPSFSTAILATVRTMEMSAYAPIFRALRRGDLEGAAHALQDSGWCGGPGAPCPGYGAEVLQIYRSGNWKAYAKKELH